MKVAIVGAGIGGLTCALALQRDGHEVEVYEAAPEIRAVGAGIWLAPNGQEVLRRISPAVLDEVQAGGMLMSEASVVTAAGRTLSRLPGDAFAGRYANPRTLAISRSRLHRILHAALEPGTVTLNRRFSECAIAGSVVRLRFHDGSEAAADVLVGADGIHSAVRAGLFGELPLRYSGQTCWRSLTRFRLPGSWAGKGTEIWGPQPGLRVGFSQVAEDEVYFYATALAEQGEHRPPRDEKVGLLDMLAGFPPVVTAILAETDPDALIRSDLVDLPPLRRYVVGRVALLGDAAHATTPNLGQGANQAMESALALARCFEGVVAEDSAAALLRYQQRRIRKATSIVEMSWRMNQLVNVRRPWVRAIRDAVMSRLPAPVTNGQFRRIYDVN